MLQWLKSLIELIEVSVISFLSINWSINWPIVAALFRINLKPGQVNYPFLVLNVKIFLPDLNGLIPSCAAFQN